MIDKKKKGGLAKRYSASYESKESGAPKKAGVMNWKKIDGEVSFFSPQEGKNRINIIPYEIKTKNHPLVKKGEFEVGDKDYVMDIYTHRGVGPSEATVLCLKDTFGKPCPICEQAQALRKAGKEKEAGDLKPSRRVFYNIEDLKEPGKLKVFEASHYLFEKELIDEARDDEEGGFTDFADPEEGKEIKFRCSKVKKNGFEFNEFRSFGFEDRDEPISDELLESAISFDEIMNVPTYEEVEKIFYGQEDEDSDEEKPSKKSKVDEDDDDELPKKSSKKYSDDEDSDEDEEEKPVKKSKKVEEDSDDDDDDEEEELPKKKTSKKSEPEDEDSDEEDEKPAKKSCDKDCGKCPFGHKFGEDTDEFDDCDDCGVWDKCVKSSK